MKNLQNYVFEALGKLKITDKDWSRMSDLIKKKSYNTDGKGVAGSIKDKNKAIARYVAGIKLLYPDKNINIEDELKELKDDDYFASELKYSPSNNSNFIQFLYKAYKLGATRAEIVELFNSTDTPQKYLDEIASFGTQKGKAGRWLPDGLLLFLSKENIPFSVEYSNYNGNARNNKHNNNGRKWNEAVILRLYTDTKNEGFIDFDCVTDEGGGATIYYIVNVSKNFSDYFGYKYYMNHITIKILKDIILKINSELI